MFDFSEITKFISNTSRKTRIITAAGLFFSVTAFGAMAVVPANYNDNDIELKSVSKELPLPDAVVEQAKVLENSQEQDFIREEKVLSGDTLGTLLSRMGVIDNEAFTFIRSDEKAKAMLNLKAGNVIRASVSESGRLSWLRMRVGERGDSGKELMVSRNEKGKLGVSDVAAVELERRVEMRKGVIKSSFFGAVDAADIPDAVAKKFIELFSSNIDFRADLRRDDRFNVVYESLWRDGAYAGVGRILAAEFVNAGKVHRMVWFEPKEGKGSYYNFDGKTQEKAFLKSPVAFTRISSGFGSRTHPILHTQRQHKGVDFAAPTGTPVRAAADGTVVDVGYRNGYGNFIHIKHWGKLSTAYGHLNGFAKGLSKGQKVNKGDVIGYVGSTGMATGPHLHYEFRVNNVHQNPMTVDVPEARELTKAEKEKFRKIAQDMANRFALLNPDSEPIKVGAK